MLHPFCLGSSARAGQDCGVDVFYGFEIDAIYLDRAAEDFNEQNYTSAAGRSVQFTCADGLLCPSRSNQDRSRCRKNCGGDRSTSFHNCRTRRLKVEVVLEIQADIPSGAPENDPSPSTHLRLEGLPQRPAWSKNNSTERELM